MLHTIMVTIIITWFLLVSFLKFTLDILACNHKYRIFWLCKFWMPYGFVCLKVSKDFLFFCLKFIKVCESYNAYSWLSWWPTKNKSILLKSEIIKHVEAVTWSSETHWACYLNNDDRAGIAGIHPFRICDTLIRFVETCISVNKCSFALWVVHMQERNSST